MLLGNVKIIIGNCGQLSIMILGLQLQLGTARPRTRGLCAGIGCVGGGGVVSRKKGARSMGEEKKEGKNNNNNT